MRATQALAILAVGVVVGWFANEWITEDPWTARTTRREGRPPPVTRDRDENRMPAPDPVPVDEPTVSVAAAEEPDAATPESETPAEGESRPNPFRELIQSQGPQWKAAASMQSKPRIEQLLAALGFDEATSERIKEAMLADVDRQVEQALLMMIGEAKMDADAFFYFMGLPPDLNEDLERELGTFLSDAEIATVREEVRRSHDKTLTDLADMQIGMMSVPDLTDDQRTRLREVFRGRNTMQEQMTGFAEMTRDHSVFEKLVAGEIDLAAEMKENFEPQRERISRILTPEQMKGYDRYQEQLVRQAEMGIKMMGAMLKTEDASATGK